jgi:site-specific DNA-methyltransferase (adenine-specific)
MKPYYDRSGITIYCGDNSAIMRDIIPDNHIDLTVTSPPYDLVDEDLVTHSDNGLRDYQGYDWNFVSVAKHLWRVTDKGGVVVWVVGDATINGSETGSSFRQALYFKDIGFRLHDTMIYEKDSLSFPETNRYTQIFEFMFVFSNGLPVTFNEIADRQNKWANGTKKIKGHYRNGDGKKTRHNKQNLLKNFGARFNIWRIAGGHQKSTQDKIAFDVPAIFPEALARDHIISWSNPGNLIFDPFAGSGTTLKMAQQLGRQAIGIEISEEYCKIAVDRLRQPSFFSIPDKPKSDQPQQLALSMA